MSDRRKFLKRSTESVIAIQLNLETEGFTYRKWGGPQRCKRGDWIVNNNGDVYTVDGESFARTYRPTGPCTYVKTTPVWAERTREPGDVRTKEGSTHYEAGDYLVYNDSDEGDPYAVSLSDFKRMYEDAD